MYDMSTEPAKLTAQLIGSLIGLVRSTEGNEYLVNEGTDKLILEGLSNINQDVSSEKSLTALLDRIEEEKKRLVPNCFYCTASCGRTDNYDMNELNREVEEIRTLKLRILDEITNLGAKAYQATLLENLDLTVSKFFYKALYAIGAKDWATDMLKSVLDEMSEIGEKL